MTSDGAGMSPNGAMSSLPSSVLQQAGAGGNSNFAQYLSQPSGNISRLMMQLLNQKQLPTQQTQQPQQQQTSPPPTQLHQAPSYGNFQYSNNIAQQQSSMPQSIQQPIALSNQANQQTPQITDSQSLQQQQVEWGMLSLNNPTMHLSSQPQTQQHAGDLWAQPNQGQQVQLLLSSQQQQQGNQLQPQQQLVYFNSPGGVQGYSNIAPQQTQLSGSALSLAQIPSISSLPVGFTGLSYPLGHMLIPGPIAIDGGLQMQLTGTKRGRDMDTTISPGEKVPVKKKKAEFRSKFKGVTWHKRDRKWIARVWVPSLGRVQYLGTFFKETEAAKAIEDRLKELGENSKSDCKPEEPVPDDKAESLKEERATQPLAVDA